jgi:hypothetical protein
MVGPWSDIVHSVVPCQTMHIVTLCVAWHGVDLRTMWDEGAIIVCRPCDPADALLHCCIPVIHVRVVTHLARLFRIPVHTTGHPFTVMW